MILYPLNYTITSGNVIHRLQLLHKSLKDLKLRYNFIPMICTLQTTDYAFDASMWVGAMFLKEL